MIEKNNKDYFSVDLRNFTPEYLKGDVLPEILVVSVWDVSLEYLFEKSETLTFERGVNPFTIISLDKKYITRFKEESYEKYKDS